MVGHSRDGGCAPLGWCRCCARVHAISRAAVASDPHPNPRTHNAHHAAPWRAVPPPRPFKVAIAARCGAGGAEGAADEVPAVRPRCRDRSLHIQRRQLRCSSNSPSSRCDPSCEIHPREGKVGAGRWQAGQTRAGRARPPAGVGGTGLHGRKRGRRLPRPPAPYPRGVTSCGATTPKPDARRIRPTPPPVPPAACSRRASLCADVHRARHQRRRHGARQKGGAPPPPSPPRSSLVKRRSRRTPQAGASGAQVTGGARRAIPA
eukprot:361323-Chlamydomonas_euryale.AAC.16